MQLKFFLKKDKSWQGEKVGKELIETAVRLMPRSQKNEKEMKETIAKINKMKSWFFEKINKIDKPLTRVIKKVWPTHGKKGR